MKPTRIITYAIPAPLWTPNPRAGDGLDIHQDLIQEVLASDRRLGKEGNEDVDKNRYDTICELLELAVHTRAQSDGHIADHQTRGFPCFINGPDYLGLMIDLWSRRRRGEEDWDHGRLGRTVIFPEDVKSHIQAFESLIGASGREGRPALEGRTAFLRDEVLPHGHGVVESQVLGLEVAEEDVDMSTVRGESVYHTDGPKLIRRSGRFDPEDAFRQRIRDALTSGSTVNMNNQNHVAITRVLPEFLLCTPDTPPGEIRVAYSDGSEAQPFPLRCLKRSLRQAERVLPIALMSMRHLQLDRQVVLNWFRNREIDQTSTLGNSDDYCYRHSARQLKALRDRAGSESVRIDLYHTGFEPAVVGFYRAAVESIRDGDHWLRVIPHYFQDGETFKQGPSWPPVEGEDN